MQTFNRLYGAIATCMLLASGTAYAQAQPQPQQQPQPHGQPQGQAQGQPGLTPSGAQQTCPEDMPPENCPVAQGEPGAATSTTTTTTTTSTATAPPVYAPPPAEHYQPWYARLGFGLVLGGGGSGFVGDEARAMTDIGGAWEVRGIWGTRSFLALEVEYMGSAQGINAIGLSNNAVLVGNGVTGDVRFNVIRDWYVQPFVFGGAAWRNYQLTNENFNVSDVNNSDNVLEVPVGLGFASYFGQFMLDVRGTYRMAWFNDLIPAIAGENTGSLIGSLDRWDATATIGMAF
jgi:hypothetical protein